MPAPSHTTPDEIAEYVGKSKRQVMHQIRKAKLPRENFGKLGLRIALGHANRLIQKVWLKQPMGEQEQN